jgi:hypothetical protein
MTLAPAARVHAQPTPKHNATPLLLTAVAAATAAKCYCSINSSTRGATGPVPGGSAFSFFLSVADTGYQDPDGDDVAGDAPAAVGQVQELAADGSAVPVSAAGAAAAAVVGGGAGVPAAAVAVSEKVFRVIVVDDSIINLKVCVVLLCCAALRLCSVCYVALLSSRYITV